MRIRRFERMVKVIVVEDEKLIREGLEQTVDWNKYDCDLIGMAVDGEDGERMIIEKKPDIVVTDIRMPKKNGLEMMRSVQEKSSAVFIILSGYDDFMYAKEAMSLGARGYLLKPIDDEEMEDIRAAREARENPSPAEPIDVVFKRMEEYRKKHGIS